jgi:dienelactone hydrolase
MTNQDPGGKHPDGMRDSGDALRDAAARGVCAIELEHMVRRRWRVFMAAELRRGLAAVAALVASVWHRVAATLRHARHSAPALLLGLAAASMPARAEPVALMLLDVGQGALGILSVPTHTETQAHPAVLVVHDALGRDSRADRVVEQLLALGVTVLEIEPFPTAIDGAVTLPHLDDLEAAALVTAAADALVAHAGANPQAIGALGFGAGARAVLLAAPGAQARAPFAARALLYPGCQTLRRALAAQEAAPLPPHAAPRGEVLLLHGGRDPANTEAACATLAGDIGAAAEVRHVVIPEAGYAWDYVAPGAIAGPTMLPASGIPNDRAVAEPWTGAAIFAADTVTVFLTQALAARFAGTSAP